MVRKKKKKKEEEIGYIKEMGKMRNGMWGSREEENYYNPMQGMAADDKRIECGGLTRNFKVSSHTHTHTHRELKVKRRKNPIAPRYRRVDTKRAEERSI